MKTCIKCGVDKSLDSYSAHKASKDGKCSSCKECQAAYSKAYHIANRDAIRARHQMRYLEARNTSADISGLKRCNTCQETKSLNAFSRGYTPDGRQYTCKDCQSSDRLIRQYGISLDDYGRMLEDQLGLCGNPGCFNVPDKRRFDIDHDHTCCPGKKSCGACLRKLLCNQCNQALGLLNEDPQRLQGLIDYLAMTKSRPS